MAQPIAQPSQGPRRSHQRNRSTTAVPTDAAKVASKSMAVGPRQICLSARAAPWRASERGQRARVHALSARYRCTLTTMPPPHRPAGASLRTPGRRRVRLFMTHDDMSRSSSSRDARGRRADRTRAAGRPCSRRAPPRPPYSAGLARATRPWSDAWHGDYVRGPASVQLAGACGGRWCASCSYGTARLNQTFATHGWRYPLHEEISRCSGRLT